MTVAAKHPRLVSAVLLALTLVAGFAVGVAWGGDAEPAPADAPGSGDDTPDVRDDARERSRDARGDGRQNGRDGRERRALVIHEIGLDPATRAQVDQIIDHFGAQMRELDREFRDTYRPRQRALIAQTRDSIRSVLTPPQVARYDSLLAVRYDNRDRDRDRGRRPGSGPSREDR